MKATQIRFLYSALLIILLHATTSIAQTRGNGKNLVIILLDFSTSIDTANTTKELLKNAENLLSCLPENTEYYLYKISKGTRNDLAHDSTSRDAYRNLRGISTSMNKVKKAAAEKQENCTCINTTLEVTADNIEVMNSHSQYNKIYLVMLSDMQLVCKWGNDTIDLEHHQFAKANRVLNSWAVGKEQLFAYKNLNIRIVLTAQNHNDYSEIKNFWISYFKKTGYPNKLLFTNTVSKNIF